jgi:hypothetical protein
MANPRTKFPNHDRIIHPDGVAGFVDENLARLSKAFTDIVLANLEWAPTLAACDGLLAPCSQLRTALVETLSIQAKMSWDSPLVNRSFDSSSAATSGGRSGIRGSWC